MICALNIQIKPPVCKVSASWATHLLKVLFRPPDHGPYASLPPRDEGASGPAIYNLKCPPRDPEKPVGTETNPRLSVPHIKQNPVPSGQTNSTSE